MGKVSDRKQGWWGCHELRHFCYLARGSRGQVGDPQELHPGKRRIGPTPRNESLSLRLPPVYTSPIPDAASFLHCFPSLTKPSQLFSTACLQTRGFGFEAEECELLDEDATSTRTIPTIAIVWRRGC